MISLIIFIIGGIACLIIQGIAIWRYSNAEKISATIINSESSMKHVRNQYRFIYNNQEYSLWGPWHEVLNPLETIFPTVKNGKETKIHLDTKNMKIVYLGFMLVIWIIVGLSSLATGVLGLLIIYMR